MLRNHGACVRTPVPAVPLTRSYVALTIPSSRMSTNAVSASTAATTAMPSIVAWLFVCTRDPTHRASSGAPVHTFTVSTAITAASRMRLSCLAIPRGNVPGRACFPPCGVEVCEGLPMARLRTAVVLALLGVAVAAPGGGARAAAAPCTAWHQRTVVSGLGILENLEFDRVGGLFLSASQSKAIERLPPD